jgi:hypothetical protein
MTAFSGPLHNYMHCMLYLIICMYVTYLRKYLFILFIIYVETLYWAALGFVIWCLIPILPAAGSLTT